jgi:hypothetical protein
MNNNIHTEVNDQVSQLELGFNGARLQPQQRQSRGTNRAAWWFRQMREVVDMVREHSSRVLSITRPAAPGARPHLGRQLFGMTPRSRTGSETKRDDFGILPMIDQID